MLTAVLENILTLEDFYKSIRSQQEEYHGKEYCAHHDAITKYAKDCKSYKELGTHQGATAAAACFAGFESVTLVDHNHYKLNPNKIVFESYCGAHDIDLTVMESDSTHSRTVSDVDMLLIDSRHTYQHCKKELKVHHKSVKKYILFHDTAAKLDLKRAVDEFLNGHDEWELLEQYDKNVGYTVIGRK